MTNGCYHTYFCIRIYHSAHRWRSHPVIWHHVTWGQLKTRLLFHVWWTNTVVTMSSLPWRFPAVMVLSIRPVCHGLFLQTGCSVHVVHRNQLIIMETTWHGQTGGAAVPVHTRVYTGRYVLRPLVSASLKNTDWSRPTWQNTLTFNNLLSALLQN